MARIFLCISTFCCNADTYNLYENENSKKRIAYNYDDIDIFNQDMNIWAEDKFLCQLDEDTENEKTKENFIHLKKLNKNKSLNFEFWNSKNLSNAKTEQFYCSDPKTEVFSSNADFLLNQNDLEYQQKRKLLDDEQERRSKNFVSQKNNIEIIRLDTLKNFELTNRFNSTGEMEFIFKNRDLKIPLLNFDNLSNLNYDSEKEIYLDNQDKLRKIKERFEKIKEMK